jgi:hypothetical protein
MMTLLLLIAATLFGPANGEAAGKIVVIADAVVLSTVTDLPAINVSAFREISFLGTNSTGNASLTFGFADQPASFGDSPARPIVSVANCIVGAFVVGGGVGRCTSTAAGSPYQNEPAGAADGVYRVAGPDLVVRLSPGTLGQVVTLKIYGRK